MEDQENGWISSDRMWAIIPLAGNAQKHGNKYVSINNGKQISVHRSMQTALNFVNRESKKRGKYQ